MGIKQVRRKFPRDFKREVVRSLLEEQRQVLDVAREHDIHPNILHRWKREYLLYNDNAFPGKGHTKHPREEMDRLQKELESVKEERDILKKALAILSERSR